MIVTFDPLLPKTISPNYSWDDGYPSLEDNVQDVVVDSEGYYVGYAPFVLMRLSSVPVLQDCLDSSSYTIFRSVDFEDHYNCQTRQLSTLGFDETQYCHVYVMPGTYEISTAYSAYTAAADPGKDPTIVYEQEPISEYEAPVFDLITGKNRGRIYWTWEKLVCDAEQICDTGRIEPTITSVPWVSAECGNFYEKTWEDAMTSCNLTWRDAKSPLKVYCDVTWKTTKEEEECSTWRDTKATDSCDSCTTWSHVKQKNFCTFNWKNTKAENECRSWKDLSQERLCTRWIQATEDYIRTQLVSDLVDDPCNPTCRTWKNTKEDCSCLTWRETRFGDFDACFEAPPVLTPFKSLVNTSAYKIKVLEIPPDAYITADLPDQQDQISPLATTLTSRFTKCGSFPIEKIVWDLGDGSPLLTQRRWAINNSYPFVYTGALSADPKDPRNYDIEHVYEVTDESSRTFYPSLTAYAYSTGTTDCAATVIGPIKSQQYSLFDNRLTLLQNNINDQKTFAALLQIGNDIAAVKFDE